MGLYRTLEKHLLLYVFRRGVSRISIIFKPSSFTMTDRRLSAVRIYLHGIT